MNLRASCRIVSTMALAGSLAVVPVSPSFALPKAPPAQLAPEAVGLTAETFAAPPTSVRPKMRWWMPLAPMKDSTVRAEVADIAAAGFSGVEILGTPTEDPSLVAEYGFGSPAWNHTMDVVLEEAEKHGLTVDFTASASYPAAVPMDPNAPATAKELVHGRAFVDGGTQFNAAVPEPTLAPRNGVTERELVAVTAARLAEGSTAESKPVRLMESSVVDLTSKVQDGRLSWSAPAGGQWVLIAWWQRPDGDTVDNVTSPTSYTVDHLSEAGATALTEFWEQTLITPEVQERLAATGGDIFEDSLHLDPNILWTPAFLAEFEKRRGYDLTPYLPAISITGLNRFFNFPVNIETPADFDFEGDTGERIRNDYYQTLTDLYVENHLDPLREWSNAQGLQLRVQPSYGQSLEITQAALAVDVPETESFQLQNMIDGFRTQAAAVHMGDKPIYSTECCASFGAAHAFKWEQTLSQVHKNLAGGVNQVVFHGYPHQDGPGSIWPGWYHFGNAGFSENYGAQPTWAQVKEPADYLGRQQLLLRQGEAKVDVAVYRNSYWDYGRAGNGKLKGKPQYYNDKGLEQSGFTYEFLSPELLDLPTATVHKGRLDAEGPAYKALVIDQQADMPVESARKIVDLATQGLPVVVVGEAPTRTPFFDDSGTQDAAVQAAMEELMAMPGVVHVAEEADVTGALAQLKVQASAAYDQDSEVLNVRRTDGKTQYYWFYNPSKTDETVEVQLEGRGQPYELEAWSGEIKPIGQYQAGKDSVTTELKLAPGETTAIALTTNNSQFHAKPGGLSVTSGDTDVAYDGKKLVAQVTTEGQHSFTLHSGKTRSVTVDDVPDAPDLGPWQLSVESWKPGATPDQTVKETQELTLSALKPWSQIPELQDVSGIGTYTNDFVLPEDWSATNGARLDLGEVFDTVKVTVNGQELPGVDMINPVVDISPYLRPGTNELQVEVATTLRNTMRTVPGSGQQNAARQPYGLVGPVRITPFTKAVLG
ncbi:glycosyl hydrolase [Kocuria sp. U4B]